MVDEKINLSINDGDAFYAHELSINFNPLQFVFDFKSVTPRVDPRSKDRASIVMKHNVVLVDPYHAKRVYGLLGDVIKKYEKEFGKIEKPKVLQILEKKNKKDKKESGKQIPAKIEAPSYIS
ncbi:MAG: DUF3467 domain-containing protein [Nanoarchaeota archaeon]|nr:DUF3467 domain-containing protein [Nanoarchaeota archaeon]MBU1004818.1 DUF3467 domain-containing protein [Nanoarchaeota archaeon]MBU1946609.1 DUF3467 domain-containing protein [Nanoarchaeota archaeon]